MGVESVSVEEALPHADTLEISCHSPTENTLLHWQYSCQLWNPWKAKDIEAIEAIQRTFAYKITEVQHLNYWERLHELKLYSLQRRRERYVIIYSWKITQHIWCQILMVQWGITIKTRKHPRK